MRGILKFNEPLAPYTSWQVGGVADQYYRPVDWDDLAQFLSTLPKEIPITWLGLGSNVLINDHGIRGLVIHLLSCHSHEAISQMGEKIRVEAGVPCAKIAKFCAKQGLVGAEFFAGIPGTLGGALAMNAGAWGSETWNNVVEVEVMNRSGKRTIRSPSEYTIGYRTVESMQSEEWFIAGYFNFAKGDPADADKKIKELLRERKAKQPIGVYSCGSVFRNPESDHAGRLIEASKLKGFTIGEAQVSPKHANFIINLGKATAADILKLIEHIQAKVLHDHQILLHPEVRILG